MGGSVIVIFGSVGLLVMFFISLFDLCAWKSSLVVVLV